MISLDSVEFYVLAAVAAAAVVGLCVRPSQKGEAHKHLIAGSLASVAGSDEPGIDIGVSDDGSVEIVRRGLDGLVRADGAVSLAVTVAGFDILVEERLTPGAGSEEGPDPTEARFILDFLGQEHYHLRYYSETTGGMAATGMHVRPGITISRRLG